MNGHPTPTRVPTSLGFLIFLILLLPLVAMLLFPRVGWAVMGIWFWMMLLLMLWGAWMLFAMRRSAAMAMPMAPQPRMIGFEEIPEPVRRVMDVRLGVEHGGVQVYRGPLRESPEQAFDALKRDFEPQRFVPLIQEDEQLGNAIVLMPRPIEEARLEQRS